MPFLTDHIYSNFHRRLYGAAGSQVAIVSDHGNVQIVEGADGNRFPVRTELVCDEPLTEIPQLMKREEGKSGRGQKKKATTVTQSNLF